MNAEILYVGKDTIYIHYTGWSAKYDESLSFHSPRILTQWEPTKPIHLNNRIDAYHKFGGWLEARVIEINYDGEDPTSQVKVHFTNYHPKYDIWVDLKDNNQVSVIGSRSKAYGIGKKKSKNYKSKLSEMILSIIPH